MAFDVSKFLALTVLIASTGAACSSDSDDPAPGGGGSSGSAGKSNQGGGAAGESGSGGAAAGEGGAAVGGATVGGAGAGGAGAGGESLGGGGAGGATDIGECLGPVAVGGAGGAAAVEPSLEDLCASFGDTDCGQEGVYAPSFMLCNGVLFTAEPVVAVAVADCLTALSLTDQCDKAKVNACFTSLEGQGCAKESSAPACAAMQGRVDCAAIDLPTCEKIADLVSDEGFQGFTGCMNPGNEDYYDTEFTGTCVERLDACVGLRL